MTKKNTRNGVHAQRLKAIRPYINFNYDLRRPLTHHQKARIREYYKEIAELTQRGAIVFRPRRKDHLKTAQKFAQHEKHLPGLKVAFIPIASETDIPQVKFNKKGDIVVKGKYVRSKFIKLSVDGLIKDAKSEVERAIKKVKDAKAFQVQAGKHLIAETFSRETIAMNVARLQQKYSNDDKSNYFGNWMHGLLAHNFKNQSDIKEYRAEQFEAQLRKKRERNKRRNERKRAKNKQ